jgi:hypothetical protein
MVSMLDDLASLGSALAKTQQQKAWGSKAARANAARHIIRRLLSLRAEGLAMYLPMPLGQQFHACHAKWRLADGSNRSGKTMTTAVEAARAWCGCDPYNKYPPKSGNSLVVSLDNDHLSMLWRKCAEPGAFKIIPDEHTKLWRAVRPDPNNPTQIDPYDEAYREKWRDAPPLIPPRMIAGEPAWDEKKRGIPRVVKFTNGWKALFRSSEGKPPQGDHYNLVMFDEEMENTNFYYEAVRGLVSTGEAPQHAPKGIWSATAQVANYELAELRDKAEHGSEHVKLFKFHIARTHPNLRVIEIPVAFNINYDWTYSNLDRSIAAGYRAADAVVARYRQEVAEAWAEPERAAPARPAGAAKQATKVS